ncbi:MAG: tripartite tricarboxylate transporter substrate binding protein [Deltaproteobacteria bacterium]|nr:tripartite tricarboxylate transporter substrate binding protein [Deltaproteobacteria bacterium]
MRKTFLTLVLFAFVIAGTVSAFAADFPTKPIEMQVAYAAGGLVDSMARAIAKNMEETLGQPVVVVNKPGAGGALGVTALKSAKPDGYTIGVVTGITLTYTPLVEKVSYSLDDFKYLASVGRFQEAFVAPPDKPYKNFKELVAYAKKNPGMTYASMNIIAENILTAVAKKEKIDWRAIPTKGGSEVMTAVVGKHVDFGFSGGIHPPFVKAGDMIVLAGLGKKRLLASPEVPTLIEYGYDLFFDNDNIIFAPKGIPDDVAKKLTAAIEKAAKDPKYVDLLQNKFLIPALCLTGDELTKSLQEGVKANQKFIDASK